jgi:carbonic anhydrase/acetyltransferase-like protein (isoleucine patch superfamily)
MLIEFNGKRPNIHKTAFIAPNATLIGDVIVGQGASIWFGAVLRADFGKIVIGARSSIQDNVVIHTLPGGQTTIEEDVTVAHGAVLHTCTAKKGCVIGMNAVILDNAVVGEQSMVAALGLVNTGKEIPPRHLAAGIPAVLKKELTGESLFWVTQSAAIYTELTERYREQGIGNRD